MAEIETGQKGCRQLADVHQEVLDKWDKPTINKPLTELVEASFECKMAPLEVAWVLKQRQKGKLRNPKLAHPHFAPNPLLDVPGGKLPESDNELVNECMACLKQISPRKSAILDRKPCNLILRKSNLQPKAVTCDWK